MGPVGKGDGGRDARHDRRTAGVLQTSGQGHARADDDAVEGPGLAHAAAEQKRHSGDPQPRGGGLLRVVTREEM